MTNTNTRLNLGDITKYGLLGYKNPFSLTTANDCLWMSQKWDRKRCKSKRLTFLYAFLCLQKLTQLNIYQKLNFKCSHINRFTEQKCVSKFLLIYYHISTNNRKSALPSIEMVNGFLCLTICLDTRYGIKQTSTNITHTHRHDLKDFISILPPNNRFQFHPTLKHKFTNKALFQTIQTKKRYFLFLCWDLIKMHIHNTMLHFTI